MKKKGQMKIMQMTFMILGVFFFFVLVGLFFMAISFKDMKTGAEALQKEQTISSIGVIAGMSELSYGSSDIMSLDEDKLLIMSGTATDRYEEFWPIASLEVYKVYPAFSSVVDCPGADCNHYVIFDSGQENVETYSSYVSICKRMKESGSVYDRCEIGKIVVGVKLGSG